MGRLKSYSLILYFISFITLSLYLFSNLINGNDNLAGYNVISYISAFIVILILPLLGFILGIIYLVKEKVGFLKSLIISLSGIITLIIFTFIAAMTTNGEELTSLILLCLWLSFSGSTVIILINAIILFIIKVKRRTGYQDQ